VRCASGAGELLRRDVPGVASASRALTGAPLEHLTHEHVALDFAGAEEELGAATIDAGSLASPESLEEFLEKEWVRSLFALSVENLRELCVEKERERTFQLFEAYDLEGDSNISYERLAAEYGIAASDVTNALAWARREFRKIALERLRELCSSEDEFLREAKAVFGWDAQ